MTPKSETGSLEHFSHTLSETTSHKPRGYLSYPSNDYCDIYRQKGEEKQFARRGVVIFFWGENKTEPCTNTEQSGTEGRHMRTQILLFAIKIHRSLFFLA